jgi:hypothetical protein
LLVGVRDAVGEGVGFPCVGAEPLPASVGEDVCVGLMPVLVAGKNGRGVLGVEVGAPGGTVSVGNSVAVGVRVRVDVDVGVRVEVGVTVGVDVGV